MSYFVPVYKQGEFACEDVFILATARMSNISTVALFPLAVSVPVHKLVWSLSFDGHHPLENESSFDTRLLNLVSAC
jgi:hypothetical protein